MSDAVLGMIETLSHLHRRNVTLTFDYDKHSWRAECAGQMSWSLVGPEDALGQLADKLKANPLEKTDKYPVTHEPRSILA